MTIRGVVLVLAVLTAGRTAGAQESAGIQRGVVLETDSVRVGDPFRVTVRIRAPRGATIDFPAAPDSSAAVEPLNRVEVVPSQDTTATEQTATYRLAAWDIGRFPIRFAPVLVRVDGVERRVPLGQDLAIEVRSVLPADTAQHVPKPVRPVFEFGIPWWYWLLAALAAAAVLGLLWWWWRRRPKAPVAPADPLAEAHAAFDRIDAMGLVAAGESGHHVALVIDVLRTYLSQVIEDARVSWTTSELVVALKGTSAVPLPRLSRLLHDADLIKFARHAVTDDRAREMGRESRALVDAVHDALHPVVSKEAA